MEYQEFGFKGRTSECCSTIYVFGGINEEEESLKDISFSIVFETIQTLFLLDYRLDII